MHIAYKLQLNIAEVHKELLQITDFDDKPAQIVNRNNARLLWRTDIVDHFLKWVPKR